MPVQFSDILQERNAVRSCVGLFDLCHMSRFSLQGAGALPLLNSLLTNDLSSLQPGRGLYSPFANQAGGLDDDVIVYQTGSERFLWVGNASRRAVDAEVLLKQRGGVRVSDESEQLAMVAVQGPQAEAVLRELVGAQVLRLRRFDAGWFDLRQTPTLVARTGYTGEDGFEIFAPAEQAVSLWNLCLDVVRAHQGLPCGLGARDLLRIEAGYPLYGNELGPDCNPFEAGLGFAIKLDKGDFRGREALLRKKSEQRRKLMALVMEQGRVPRPGSPVWAEAVNVGVVTSGSFSPLTGTGVGLAYIQLAYAEPGRPVGVELSGKRYAARLAQRPLYPWRQARSPKLGPTGLFC